MAKTGYFRGAGGTIFKMDLPLRENHQDQVKNGTLVEVLGEVVEVQGGEGEGIHYRLAEPKTEAVDPDAVPTGSVDKVLEWVGDDRDRAQRALMAEQSKGDKARASLVKTLSEKVSTP